MCGPPGLIKMWWSTLKTYFGIDPCVMHGTNTKYKRNDWNSEPTQKFILVSYIILVEHINSVDWFNQNRDILIVDEAHHYAALPYKKFKEVIGLSATTKKKRGLSSGITHILRSLDMRRLPKDKYTYNLGKNVIAKKLPNVRFISYDLPYEIFDKTYLTRLIGFIKSNKEYDLRSVETICKNLSHPYIKELKSNGEYFTAGIIMVGRKNMHVDTGNYKKYTNLFDTLDNTIPYKKRLQLMTSQVNFQIIDVGLKYPKYTQAYHIIKRANDNGEKVLLFDITTRYLPFLHQFLVHHGINSYLFSTHYDVTGRQRQLTRFKEDKNPGVLLSSIAMLGEGQNVTEANHVIFFSQCMDNTKYYQAIGRCWRYPQSRIVNVHLLFGSLFDRKVYEHACDKVNLKTLKWVDIIKYNR